MNSNLSLKDFFEQYFYFKDEFYFKKVDFNLTLESIIKIDIYYEDIKFTRKLTNTLKKFFFCFFNYRSFDFKHIKELNKYQVCFQFYNINNSNNFMNNTSNLINNDFVLKFNNKNFEELFEEFKRKSQKLNKEHKYQDFLKKNFFSEEDRVLDLKIVKKNSKFILLQTNVFIPSLNGQYLKVYLVDKKEFYSKRYKQINNLINSDKNIFCGKFKIKKIDYFKFSPLKVRTEILFTELNENKFLIKKIFSMFND